MQNPSTGEMTVHPEFLSGIQELEELGCSARSLHPIHRFLQRCLCGIKMEDRLHELAAVRLDPVRLEGIAVLAHARASTDSLPASSLRRRMRPVVLSADSAPTR